MQAVQYISNWIKYILVLNPVITTFTVLYLSIKKSLTKDPDDDSSSSAIPKVIFAAVIVECISGFLTVVKNFF